MEDQKISRRLSHFASALQGSNQNKTEEVPRPLAMVPTASKFPKSDDDVVIVRYLSNSYVS